MKWKHALDEGLGIVKKGIEVYNTGKALYQAGSTLAAGFRSIAPVMGMML